jgi:hypothetical protein
MSFNIPNNVYTKNKTNGRDGESNQGLIRWQSKLLLNSYHEMYSIYLVSLSSNSKISNKIWIFCSVTLVTVDAREQRSYTLTQTWHENMDTGWD